MTEPPLSPNAWLRYDVVVRLLRGVDVSSVLEIGAGQGGFAARLAARYTYVGVEPDAMSFETARGRLGGKGTLLYGDVAAVEAGRTFDLLCAFEVLEHIEDDRAALRTWRTRIRPRGWILLSVPAVADRFGPHDRLAGHYRRYDRADLQDVLVETGFVEPQIRNYGFPLGNVLETARNVMARRSPRSDAITERTAVSGRLRQPPERLGWATRTTTAPFRRLQRSFEAGDRGPGFVALARCCD